MSSPFKQLLANILQREGELLLDGIFYRAIQSKHDYIRFYLDDRNNMDYGVIYAWWGEFLDLSVNDWLLRDYMYKTLCDEDILHFLTEIHIKYKEDIDVHYNNMCDA